VTPEPKPRIDPVRWTPPPVDTLPDFGPADLTVIPVPGKAPEDVVVDGDGNIWTGVDDRRIVRICPDGEATVVGETGGRPLGLAVARDGRLLVCTSPGGLLAMNTDSGKFETIVDQVDGRRLQFCSNVTEMPDGTIYFTESTSAFTYANYIGAFFEARGRGSLFRARWPTDWRRARRSCVRCCGGCPIESSPSRSRWCGPSRSTPTASRRSRVCRPSTRRSAR
jgi:sugar lactone lactonase YvrE